MQSNGKFLMLAKSTHDSRALNACQINLSIQNCTFFSKQIKNHYRTALHSPLHNHKDCKEQPQLLTSVKNLENKVPISQLSVLLCDIQTGQIDVIFHQIWRKTISSTYVKQTRELHCFSWNSKILYYTKAHRHEAQLSEFWHMCGIRPSPAPLNRNLISWQAQSYFTLKNSQS